MIKLLKIIKYITNHPLTKKDKLKTITKFVVWQLITKFFRGRFIVKWVNNSKFIISKSETGVSGNYYCGFAEYEDMLFALHYLRNTDFFYDIGANVGAYTILASKVVGCKSKSFEPIPETFDRLVDQIKINRIDKLVDLINCGVSDKQGYINFTNNLDTKNKVTLDIDSKNKTKARVINLDNEKISNQDIIVKIDVEGYEKFVIDGGHNFFSHKSVKVLIVEINQNITNYGVEISDIHKLICSFGFFPISYDPIHRKLKKISIPNKEKNTIYIKDLVFTEKRCISASKVKVHTAGGISI